MTFEYKNKEYEIMESGQDFFIVMEIQYIKFVDNKKILIKKEEWESEEYTPYYTCLTYRFINYFYGVKESENIIEIAKSYIDHEYDKDISEIKFLLMQLRKAQIEFEHDFENNNDTKGSLDRLEYAQSDIYDWVKENLQIDEKGE